MIPEDLEHFYRLIELINERDLLTDDNHISMRTVPQLHMLVTFYAPICKPFTPQYHSKLLITPFPISSL
jgi:hypothetical protein